MVGTVTVGIGVSPFGAAGACAAGGAGVAPGAGLAGAAGEGAEAGGFAVAGAPPVTRSTILLCPPAGLAAWSEITGVLSLMARSAGFSFHRTAKPALIATAATMRTSAIHGHGLRRRGLCKPGAAGRPDSFAPLTGGAA